MTVQNREKLLLLNEWEFKPINWLELNILEPIKWIEQNREKLENLKSIIKITPFIKPGIRTRSYVGSILLENLLIQVKPKISDIKLMKLLSFTFNLDKIKPNTFSLYNSKRDGFLELLLLQLINQVERILNRGLYKDYKEKQEDLKSPRGKIDFQRYTRRFFINKDSISCNYYLRLNNNIFNQILLSGMNRAAFLTQNLRIRFTLLELVKIFKENVKFIECSAVFINKALNNITRLTENYRSAITLIKIIETPPTFIDKKEEKTMKMYGFFFDMNIFFQNLLLKFFIETLGQDCVKSELSIKNMYRFITNPYGKKNPKLRPDYLILDEEKNQIILDAKYKDLSKKSLPSKWLYQLSMYALSGSFSPNQVNRSIILYTTNDIYAKDAEIQINKPNLEKKGQKAYVIIRPVMWEMLHEYLIERKDSKRRNEAKQFAKALINKDKIEKFYLNQKVDLFESESRVKINHS